MKKKIFLMLGLVGFLGICFASSISAKSLNQEHRVYPEFKPTPATDVEIVKKASLPGKGKPTNSPGKPYKEPESPEGATGMIGETVAGNRYAVVIGISDYPGTANDLNYTDNDALAMRDVLVNKYNFIDTDIYLLTDGEVASDNSDIVYMSPTAQNIYSAIIDLRDYRNLSVDDEVVFFYSGHGGKGMADDGDKEKRDESIISYDGENLVHIWDGDLKNWFSGFATSRIVFIFDSCVAGGMTDLAKEGRIINMATEEKGRFDSAVELSTLGYGEFTYYFVVEGMLNDKADVYDHGYRSFIPGSDVVVEEAFDYAKANTNYDHPTISDLFTDDLLF